MTKRIFTPLSFLIAVVIIAAAAFVLMPRFYEPGGEAWRQWAAARIMGETGGFPVFSLGPGYVAYLQIFKLFQYPLSVNIEYFITHMFAYIAIFMMMSNFVPFILALLITCAWIPNIAILEPGGLVAGIGFIALYLGSGKDSPFNRGYAPPSLLAALLCHSAYLLFFVGNFIGVAFERYLGNKEMFSFSCSLKEIKIFPAASRIILFAIILLTLLFQSHRPDNNQMLSDPTYVPVPLNNPVSVTFFHVGNWKYAMRTMPKEAQIYQDWYLTNDKAFGGAKTIAEAVIRRPSIVFANMADSAVQILKIPMRFLTGNFQGVLPRSLTAFFIAASLLLAYIGFVGAFRYFKMTGLVPVIWSIILGGAAITAALLLTWCSHRYIMTLLPIGLLVLANIGYGIGGLFHIDHKRTTHINNSIILLSAALVLYTAAYPEGRSTQINAVFNNKGILSGAKPISMAAAHYKLTANLHQDSNVLAIEESWIKAFTDVKLEGVHSVYGLPPFSDQSGKTEGSLEGLDVILVNNQWSRPIPGVSTQAFLRYRLHVEPFLEKALKQGWTVEEIEGYGKMYKRPK